MLAQTPASFTYQAALRNSDGSIVANQPATVLIEILSGTTDGPAVFTETHTTTTTPLGIVNLAIGSINNLGVVDWSANQHFIKITFNSVVMGVVQLLSVPYSLHAKTAETLTSEIEETDPVFIAWDKDYNDLINTPAAPDGSETKVNAGTNVSVTGAGTTANPYIVNATSGGGGFTHYIGEQYGGGVIFHLWKDNAGVEHGLIVAVTDQSTSQAWSNVGSTLIGSSAQSSWDGLSNSNAIVGQAGHTSSAAKLCLDLESGGQNDWYLPAIDELSLLWHNRFNVNKALSTIGGATVLPNSVYYWSSTEYDATFVFSFTFYFGHQLSRDKTSTYRVRAVRAF
jgi:hypothetical protein